jgi:cell division septum initiation protein DivIVA
MIKYNRLKHTVDGYSTARSRAQNATHKVVSEMQIRGYSAEDMALYYDAIRDDRATMELIAEHCENKLKELKRKSKRQPTRKGLKAGTIPLRHSMRLRKREVRKRATEG